MRTVSRWLFVGILILFGVLSFNEGLNIWELRTNIDGDGIGVYFLGLEINDRVAEKNIPSYSIGFFITSVLALTISFVFLLKNLKPRNKASKFQTGE